MRKVISFNEPFIAGKELYYIANSVISGNIAGDGLYGKKCEAILVSSRSRAPSSDVLPSQKPK